MSTKSSGSPPPETRSKLLPVFEEILVSPDWPRLDRSFFDSDRVSHGGFSAKFYDRLGVEDGAAIPDSLHASIAAALQKAIERAVLCMAGSASNLCLAGGLGFNALLVSSLEQSRNVFVQPAAGNTGTAIGAVLHAWHSVYRQTKRASLNDLCLGPSYSSEDVKKVLENCKLRFRYLITTEELDGTGRRGAEQSKDHRLDAGSHGIRTARARESQHSGVSAQPVLH